MIKTYYIYKIKKILDETLKVRFFLYGKVTDNVIIYDDYYICRINSKANDCCNYIFKNDKNRYIKIHYNSTPDSYNKKYISIEIYVCSYGGTMLANYSIEQADLENVKIIYKLLKITYDNYTKDIIKEKCKIQEG